MVEQRIHKPKVGSSTLPPATTKGFLGSLGSENHEVVSHPPQEAAAVKLTRLTGARGSWLLTN